MLKNINIAIEINIDDKDENKCGESCKYNGKIRYGQPGAMHLPPEEYWAKDYCQLFRADLKYDDNRCPIRCGMCIESDCK